MISKRGLSSRKPSRLRLRFPSATLAHLCKPFGLPSELPDNAVKDIDSRLELYPWEYDHEAKSDKEIKTITVSSPVKYLLIYRTAYTLSQVRQLLAGKGDRRQDDI